MCSKLTYFPEKKTEEIEMLILINVKHWNIAKIQWLKLANVGL